MHIVLPSPPKFPLGRLVATAHAVSVLSVVDVSRALARQGACDWGDLDAADRAANDAAVTEEARIVSAHRGSIGIAFWIITEWDRSATTILLPEDY